MQFVPLADGDYEIVPASRSVGDLAGYLARAPKTLSIEQMDEAVAASMAASESTR